jgi:diguanylate cyclase (GGDEF)-like protein/hemerythrin-like metal-binding protein
MPSLLVAQLDYIYFFYGLVLFLLGVVCLSMSRNGALPTPWWLLGAFAFTHGTAEWLHLVALAGGDSLPFRTARNLLLGAAFLLLFEFARRTHRVVFGRAVSPWLSLVPVAGSLGLMLASTFATLNASVRLAIALPAGLWTAGLFLAAAARTGTLGGTAGSRRARWWAGACFAIFALAAGAVVPAAPFLPGHWPSTQAVQVWSGAPIQLVRALLVCGVALSVWGLALSKDPKGSVGRKKQLLFWVMASSLVVLLACGWLFTDWLGRLHQQNARRQAQSSASQIFDHLVDEMRGAEGGARAAASLLNRIAWSGDGPAPARLNEVADALAMGEAGWVVYVLDRDGTTIASSNRDRPDSFMGVNYRARPYFKEAMAGHPGRFIGMGIVSKVPGYFASEPVRGPDGLVVGVVALKCSFADDQLGPTGIDTAYVVSADGRVLVSNEKAQATRALWSQVDGTPSGVPPADPAAAPLFARQLEGTEFVTVSGEKRVAVRRPLPGSDWSLVVLKSEPTQAVNRLLGIVITLLICGIVLGTFVVVQRQLGTESAITDRRREAEGRAREYARQADTDALTGVLNRLGFNGAFSREFERARRYQQPLSVVMLDLDHFKRINDAHGHAAGDQVLAGVARLVEANIRDSDIMARWGGEEFVVVAPQTSLQGAALLAEKLRALMETSPLGPVGPVTGSFGVAELRPGDSVEHLLHRADEALYRAKGEGRNRVKQDESQSGEAARGGALPSAVPASGPPRIPPHDQTGFDPIDQDHLELAQCLQQLVEAVEGGGAEPIQSALESLLAELESHFAMEEELMATYAYPLRARHQEAHELFIDDARRFRQELKVSGVTVSFRRWVVGRLVEWFRFHILSHDVGLGHFLQKASQRAEPARAEAV